MPAPAPLTCITQVLLRSQLEIIYIYIYMGTQGFRSLAIMHMFTSRTPQGLWFEHITYKSMVSCTRNSSFKKCFKSLMLLTMRIYSWWCGFLWKPFTWHCWTISCGSHQHDMNFYMLNQYDIVFDVFLTFDCVALLMQSHGDPTSMVHNFVPMQSLSL